MGDQINERGFVLVMVYFFVGILLTLGGALLSVSSVECRTSRTSRNLVTALYLGEAGIDAAIQTLRTNPEHSGAAYTAVGGAAGGYVTQVNRLTPSTWMIVSTGFFPTNDSAAYDFAAKQVEAIIQLTRGGDRGIGVLGDRSVQFNGGDGDEAARLNSYDSRSGPYSLQRARANVQIRVNNPEDRAVSLIGHVMLSGDVVLAPDSDPQRALWQTAQTWTPISGSVRVAPAPAPLEPVEIPDLPDGGSLRIAGHEVVTLPGGIYRFRELDISGRGQLVFTGEAQVYVEGDVHISGHGISAASQLPTDLALYVKGAHVAMRGGANVYANLHAPYSTVDLSGYGDLYGAVVGRDITVGGNSHIHYDEALNTYDEALNPSDADAPLQASLLSWREGSP